jgi:hypothetical protein
MQRANGRKARDTVPYFVWGDFIRGTKTCVSVSTWGMGMETNRIISGAREGVATLDGSHKFPRILRAGETLLQSQQ